jgi:GLPGLI family protein
MKNLLFLIAGLLPAFAIAQNTEGIVTYLETVQFKIDIPEEHKEMMKDMPTSQSFSKVLIFNENESLYKDPDMAENTDIEMGHESEGMNFKMVMKRPENTIYADLENGTTINAREFFGRNFLVKGELKNPGWKLTGEQKKVAGYVCQKATMQQDDTAIEAWFTPQIPVSTGPGEHGQLPGLILEVNIGGGNRTIVASNVELKKLDKGAIEKPTKGKEVTQEEFDKIEEEKMKEMDMETGGSGKGGMKIIIRN